jgi:hypothetical protein
VQIRSLAPRLGVVGALALAVGAATLLPGAAPSAVAGPLVPYEDCDALLQHYRSELARSATAWGFGHGQVREEGVAVAARDSAVAATADAGDAGGSGPTGTNLQERGVDEPDVAKTSGELLLALAQGRLQVVRTGEVPELLSSTRVGETWGGELLVDGDRVLVLMPQSAPMPVDTMSGGRAIASPTQGTGELRMLLFDLADPRSPRLLDEATLDGRYLSARQTGSVVRLVTSSSAAPPATHPQEPYGPAEDQGALRANHRAARTATLEQVLPQLTRDGTTGPAVECADVRHTSSADGASTLLVTTLDLRGDLQPRDTTGVTTELHAFDTRAGDRTTYVGSGSVPGYVLGRWALSSYAGHLRVAVTDRPPWGAEQPSSSSVVVLAEEADGLRRVGAVGGLGIGERIYAVRYFGDLATVVTFRQTDPLYVLDLSAPTAPTVLGELKIPGFSTYLHPVGDDLLLGVGMDADNQGRVTGSQVSLFDLSDRSKPVQRDRISLGQGWTPAGEDSRAFGWDATRRTALLPWTTYDGREASTALGIRVTEDGRLAQAGAIPTDVPVDRVLHDGARAYAITQAGVVAAELDGFRRTGAVRFGG